LEKCEFHQKQIEYLGLVILENKVAMDPVKVARVCDWPTLENRTDIQTFIGFVNFYRCFIWDFSTIARSLFDLTRSDKAWSWDTKERGAFECLKMAVTTTLVLVSPQDLEPFHIEADSSDFASGAVLSLNNYPEKRNGTRWPSTANPCLQWNRTMRSMTRRCSLSSTHWRSGGTSWKEPDTQ